jgi:polynucleotide 5'-hydroxyl-kinase GRC3/NOL9
MEAAPPMSQPGSNGDDPLTKRKRPRPENVTSVAENISTNDQPSASFVIQWLGKAAEVFEAREPAVPLNAMVTFSRDANSNRSSNNKLCLMGRAQIHCVQGSISILGYHLTPTHPKISVESPPWSSLVMLEPNHDNDDESDDQVVVVKVESCWPQQEPQTGQVVHHQEATFALVESESPRVRPTIIPSTWENAANHILPCLYADKNETRTTLNEDHDIKANFTRPGSKTEISKIGGTLNNNGQVERHFRLAICGAKGVGKSTFLRYITNRILSDPLIACPQVAILDADVGQPEMSPPGLVTLTVLSGPLLTPPHYRSMASSLTTGVEHQYAYFFGSVTSRNDPERYLALIQQLLQHYNQDVVKMSGNIPLLINLDGWVRGLGYELLSTLLTEVLEPLSHVIQIVGTTKSKQFSLLGDVLNPETSAARLHVIHAYNSSLNSTFVADGNSSSKNEEYSAESNNDVDDGKTKSNMNNSAEAMTARTPASCVMPAKALRALRLCTYFLNDVTIWYNLGFDHEGIKDETCEIAHRLAGALPYAVPFNAVEIQWVGSDHFEEIPGHRRSQQPSDINDLVLDAINAKVVGLCRRPALTNGDSDDQGNIIGGCVGLGLVRAIDRSRKLFYILTPVDGPQLQGVTVLVGCGIDLPVEFWFRGVHAEAFPYQTFARASTTMVAAEPMKSRNNIGRKGLASS